MGGSEGCDVSQQLRDVVTHRIRDPDGEWRNVRHMTVRHTNSRSLDVDLHRLRRKSVENWKFVRPFCNVTRNAWVRSFMNLRAFDRNSRFRGPFPASA